MALRKLKYISLIFASIFCSVTVALSEQRTLSAFQSFEEVQRATEEWTQVGLDKILSAKCEVSKDINTCYTLSGIAVLKYYALRDYDSARRYLELYRKFAIQMRGAPCVEESFYISGDGNSVHFSYWAALYACNGPINIRTRSPT